VKIGIIAEDDSDVGVVSALTLTLLKPRVVGFKKFVGGGCGKLRRKCAAWAVNLVEQGCPWLVVVHDLDRNNEADLRTELGRSIAQAGAAASVVLIPRREIEAWLLYDGAAIASAFREALRPRLPGNPESLPDPKNYLRELVWARYRKTYLTTVHNAAIAKRTNTALLRRSTSFSPHFTFATRVATALRLRAERDAAHTQRRR
jgi:hypothetical protein